MIKADYIKMSPKVEVEVNRLGNGKVNFATLRISELEIELDEATYTELFEKMDFAMWDETKEDLQRKLDEEERDERREKEIVVDGIGYYGKSA